MKKNNMNLAKLNRKISNESLDYIFDTNIILVANEQQPEVSDDCISECIKWIRKLINGEIKLVLDDKDLILKEYKKRNKIENMQNISSQFLLWVYRYTGNEDHILKVPITPIKESETEFKEFPNDPDLISGNPHFEHDDRKFVATAISYFKQNKKHSPILEACDSDYISHEEALNKYVEVTLVCEKDIRELHRRKNKK